MNLAKKQINQSIFYYSHYIESFIADTVHLNVFEKYAYLTLIWEAHRKRGLLDNKSLESLMKRNKEISKETYDNILSEFWELDADDNYFNAKVTADLESTNLHKKTSSKGGKATGLQKMIESEQRQDEYNSIHDAYPTKRRVARKEGLALYCKQLQNDERMTFKKVMQVVKGFDCQPQFYPMLDTLLRDTQGKYWKAVEKVARSDYEIEVVKNEIYKTNKDFYKLTAIEQGKLINNYLKENV
jgi:uncharacterized protein YdaU (DUF1376 family)